MRKYLDDDDEDESGDIVRDGESIRVPIQVMDSRQRWVARKFGYLSDNAADNHRPHFLPLNDELLEFRAQTRRAFVQDLCNAWRGTNKVAPGAPASRAMEQRFVDRGHDPAEARAAAMAAYDAMCLRNCLAWRNAGRVADASQPDMGSRPEEWQAHARRPLPGHAGEKLDPDAAKQIKRLQETWQGRDPAELAADLEAFRQKNHAEFSARLQNAWRGGGR